MHSNYALYGSFPVNWSRNLCYFFETRDLTGLDFFFAAARAASPVINPAQVAGFITGRRCQGLCGDVGHLPRGTG